MEDLKLRFKLKESWEEKIMHIRCMYLHLLRRLADSKRCLNLGWHSLTTEVLNYVYAPRDQAKDFQLLSV